MMVFSYARIAYRNLIRHKAFSLLNIFGLAMGMTVCLIVMLYIDFELKYDTHFADHEKIYRIGYKKVDAAGEVRLAITPVPLADVLSVEANDLCIATKIIPGGNVLVSNNRHRRNENLFYYADRRFFNVFSTPFVSGDPVNALTKPDSVVVTKSTALRYFQDTDIIGQTIIVENKKQYTVTGVVEDYPGNSHFRFDFLAAFDNLPISKNRSWLSKNVYTYIKLKNSDDIEAKYDRISELIMRHVEPQFSASTGLTLQEYNMSGNILEYFLQPLNRVYLWSDLEYELDATGDIQYVYIFAIAGAGILLVACLNFMNLATARYTNRYREVGLRKTLGSSRFQLVVQFITETLFISFVALALSFSFVEVSLPLVNFLAGLDLELVNLFSPPFLFFLLVVVLFVGCVAGSYPAIFLSSFSPIQIMAGHFKTASSHIWIRKLLSVFQLVGLIALLLCTFIIYSQLRYLTTEKFATDQDKIIVIPRAYALGKKLDLFREYLDRHPDVSRISLTRDIPGEATSIIGFHDRSEPGVDMIGLNVFSADERFMEVFGVRVIQGEYLASESGQYSPTPAVINVAAVDQFIWKNPVGRELFYFNPLSKKNETYQIVGVVNDFHFESLHQPIQPMIIVPLKNSESRYINIRVSGSDYRGVLDYIELAWASFVPDRPFEHYLLEDDLKTQYFPEQRVGQVFIGFTTLAILIASSGLIGLIAFNIERRTLEIGLRKVVGATGNQIAWLLSKEILSLALLAFLVASPISTITMNAWLNRFAYHAEISSWHFLHTGLLVVCIVCVTIGFQVMKVSWRKPVELVYRSN